MKTILEFMELEHQNLLKQWRDFLIENDDKRAEGLLERFSHNLLRHIQLEDGALSPTFNRYLHIENGAGPTVTMNSEHVDILKLLDRVKVARGAHDEKMFAYVSNHFERALITHQQREEKSHYIYFDKIIPKRDWEEWEEVLKEEI